MSNFMSDFFYGLTALFRGFQILVGDSKLRTWSLIPFAVALVLGTLITISGLYFIGGSIGSFAVSLGSWISLAPGSWAIFALTLVLWPIALLALGVAVYVSVRLVVAPFYSILAELALVVIGMRKDQPFQMREWLVFTVRMLLVSLVKSLIFAVAAAILFMCSLIPLINLIATMGFVLILAFDVSDYSFEAMGWGIRRRFQHFRSHLAMYSGFAVGLGSVLVIPGMSVIIMPAAVVGGGLLLKRSADSENAAEKRSTEIRVM